MTAPATARSSSAIVSIGAFTFVASLMIWGVLKAVVGIRLSDEAESLGIDQAELGMEAYPEFGPSLGNAPS